MQKCPWCQKRDIAFEIIIYHLNLENQVVANIVGERQKQLVKGDQYLKVRICEQCLPCVATENPTRYRLRGKELKENGK